eukprot:14052803-Ditylum_brightwellii.AAC.1
MEDQFVSLAKAVVSKIKRISRIIKKYRGVPIIEETLQKRMVKLAVNVVKRKGCNMNNSLPMFWRCVKSWIYIAFVIVSLKRLFSAQGDGKTPQGYSCIFNLLGLPTVNEEDYITAIDNDNTSNNQGAHINWNNDDQSHICMNGQMVALANGEASKDEEGQLHRKLFKEIRETPEGVGILGIGGVKKPKGI